MKQSTFEQIHQAQWQQLEHWLDLLDQSGRSLDTIEFPKLYRQVCQHLALARDRHYTPYLTERLNWLVLRGHQHLYQTKTRLLPNLLNFFRFDFPNWVRTEAAFVSLSALLFFGSLFAIFIAVQIEPKLISSVMTTEEIRELEFMYSPTAEHLGRNRKADSDFYMFGFYIKHNITIAFQTFAGGIIFGLGTIFFLIFNGLVIGAVASHLTHIGYSVPFYAFVAGHSPLELTAIVLAGAAGLKLGFAVLSPQRLTRRQALHLAAVDSIHLIYGVIGMLVLAALVEAFWSSNTAIEPQYKHLVGSALWLLVIGYLAKVGEHRAT